MQSGSTQKAVWRAAAVLLPFAVIFALNTAQYLPFLSDDSLISLRYARRLLDGLGLTWTEGRPVEGYSNLLWILVVSAVGWLGVDLIDAARALGVGFSVAVMFSLAWWYSRYFKLRTSGLPLLAGLGALAFSAPLAVWAIGGLEQPLYCALLAASIPLTFAELTREQPDYRATLRLSLILGLICLTRPDGMIFPVATASALFLADLIAKRPRPLVHAALCFSLPVIFFGAQLAFRLAYYGEWVPNTALVKIAGSAEHRVFGWEYLLSGFGGMQPLSSVALAALGGLLLARSTRTKGTYLSLMALAWSAYVIFIAGDVFPAYRHLTPLIVILAFAIAESAALIARALAGRPVIVALIAVAMIALLVPYRRIQSEDKWVRRAHTERWEWQAREVALTLKSAFARAQPRMAVTAAGSLPYWSELPALDMMGLNDYYLPRHRPADFGRGMVGHELGNGQYVLDERPDLIVFDVGSADPSWRTGNELKNLPLFRERYVPVTIRTAPSRYNAVVFVDKDSPKIGIARADATITVPGFFFTGIDTVAQVNSAGELIARLTSGHPVQLTLQVDPGMAWSVDASRTNLSGIDTDFRQDAGLVTVTLRPKASSDLSRVVLAGTRRPLPASASDRRH